MNPDRINLDLDDDEEDEMPEVDDDGFEIDPALAASMGFSSFGPAPKKRKYAHHDDAVVGRPACEAASGGNAMPLGSRPTVSARGRGKGRGGRGPKEGAARLHGEGEAEVEREDCGEGESLAGWSHSEATGPSSLPLRAETARAGRVDGGGGGGVAAAGPPDLAAYKHGVVLENGDVAYFMPSFIEDPWAKLVAR